MGFYLNKIVFSIDLFFVNSSVDIDYKMALYTPMSPGDLLNKQSVPVDGQEHVRANPMMKPGQVLEYLEEDNRTLHSNFLKGLERSEGGPCLGWRPGPGEPYQWITYQQVLDRSQHFG